MHGIAANRRMRTEPPAKRPGRSPPKPAFHYSLSPEPAKSTRRAEQPASTMEVFILQTQAQPARLEQLVINFHKKGVLAAARESDDVNPGKLSSACQFYIVQGKKFTSADIAQVERRIYNNDKQTIFWQFLNKPENSRLKERYIENQSERNTDSLNYLNQLIQPQIENEIANIKIHKFTPAELEAYTEVGGAPHLDGSYTVFGEVVEGIEVVDKIAAVGVDHNNRPIEDIRMKMKIEIINY